MNGEKHQRRIQITDPQGLHMRPLQRFVQLALQCPGDVTVAKGGQRVNGKSMLELLTLGADEGTELLLEVSGDDAKGIIDALAQLLLAPESGEEPETPTL